MLRPAPVGIPMQRLASTGGGAVIGIGIVALSIVSLGIPGTLVLAGGWLLAAACSRRVPGLDGPVSWAAGVVLEVGLLSLLSLLLALVSGREHGANANTALLALPVLIGGTAFVWPARLALRLALALRRSKTPVAPPADAAPLLRCRWPIAATIMAAGLTVPLWIASHGVNNRVAWAMSGDARNHIVFVRQMLSAGGLTVSELKSYPAVIDSVTALLSGAGGRGHVKPGGLMLHDAHALVATYVIAGIAMAALFAAALMELVPRAVLLSRRLPVGVTIVVLAAATVTVSGLVLGTSARDGYVSAYGSVPLAMAAVVLALRCCRTPAPAAFTLLGPATLLAFLSWSLLALIPMAMTVHVTALLLLRRRRSDPGSSFSVSWALASVIALGSSLVTILVTATHITLLHKQFLMPGSITSPQPRLLYALGLLAVALALTGHDSGQRVQLAVPVVVAVASIVTVKFLMWLSPDGHSWTYYAIKSLYLFACCLVWLLFVPGILLASRAAAPSTWAGSSLRVGQAVAVSAVALFALQWTTPVPIPLPPAAKGWSQPSAALVTVVSVAADESKPFVLYGLTDAGDERVADFWAALVWGYDKDGHPYTSPPYLPYGIAGWAYQETGQVRDLCLAARGTPDLQIFTSDASVRQRLNSLCPHVGAHVIMVGKVR